MVKKPSEQRGTGRSPDRAGQWAKVARNWKLHGPPLRPSPEDVRCTFPGFTYQLGNLLASGNATLQAWIAQSYGGDYALALAVVAAEVAIAVAVLAWLGVEARGVTFAGTPHPAE